MRPAPFELPGKAKIAVSFFVAFESFIKYSQYRRGGDKPDYASLAYGEYGGKAGIWRIMDVLNKYGVKGTIDTNGLVAEKFPDEVRELHRAGHRITEHTFKFLVEEGILWSGDMPGDDVPSHREVQGKPLVLMPRLDYANDLGLIFNPKNPP